MGGRGDGGGQMIGYRRGGTEGTGAAGAAAGGGGDEGGGGLGSGGDGGGNDGGGDGGGSEARRSRWWRRWWCGDGVDGEGRRRRRAWRCRAWQWLASGVASGVRQAYSSDGRSGKCVPQASRWLQQNATAMQVPHMYSSCNGCIMVWLAMSVPLAAAAVRPFRHWSRPARLACAET